MKALAEEREREKAARAKVLAEEKAKREAEEKAKKEEERKRNMAEREAEQRTWALSCVVFCVT